jgi:integrase
MRIQEVTPADIDRIFLRIARAGLSAATGRAAYRILRKSFGDAERTRIVPTNVVTRSSPPSLRASKAPTFPIWTWDELTTFLDHIDGDWLAPTIEFAALTGCRRSEVVGLRWADIDFDRGTVTIAHSVVDGRHVHPHLLRHSVASLMLAERHDIAAVAATLGHASPATTTAVYSHSLRANRVRATAAMSEAVGQW